MKKYKKITLSLSMVGLAGIIIPISLTSCAPSINSYKAKIIGSNYETQKYSSLSNSNVSIEDAVYGSSINDGNYIMIFGSDTNETFRSFLYGPNGDGNWGSNDTVTEQTFAKSSFLQTWFSDGGLGTGDNPVTILLYEDISPYNDNASSINGENGKSDPFAKYTSEEVVAMYNNMESDSVDANNLPKEWRLKINKYKRYDDSAKTFRNFVRYIDQIRPNSGFGSSTEQKSGIFAFRKKTKPAKFDATGNPHESIKKYFNEGTVA